MRSLLFAAVGWALSLGGVPRANPRPEGKSSPASVAALETAKRDWQDLKRDHKRSKYRTHWLKIAAEFGSGDRRGVRLGAARVPRHARGGQGALRRRRAL